MTNKSTHSTEKKRIAVLDEDYRLTPQEDDFKKYGTHIIVDRMLGLYTLNREGKMQMVQQFQINDVLARHGAKNTLDKLLCDFIESIPESHWENIMHELRFSRE